MALKLRHNRQSAFLQNLLCGPISQVSAFSGCVPCSRRLPSIVLISLCQVQFFFFSEFCLFNIRPYADQSYNKNL